MSHDPVLIGRAAGGCAVGVVVLCISAPLLEYAGTAESVAREGLCECSKHRGSAECFKQAGRAGFDAISIGAWP